MNDTLKKLYDIVSHIYNREHDRAYREWPMVTLPEHADPRYGEWKQVFVLVLALREAENERLLGDIKRNGT